MPTCDEIDVGSSIDCSAIPVGGTVPKLRLINWDDLDEDAPFTLTSGKITAISVKTGKQAWTFTGFRNDVKKTDEVLNPGIGINQFKHGAGWVIYERTQAQKTNIEKLARGRFVAILENKGKDADAYELLGYKVGLEIVPGPVRNAHENGGFFIINMATPDGEYEDALPKTIGASYAAAVTLVTALDTPAS